MELTPQQLDGRPKKVGTLRGKAVMEARTKGGLNLIMTPNEKNSKWENLGCGPHRAIARHIAEKREKEIIWSDLAKSDWIDPSHFEWLLPRYEALTERFRDIGSEE